MGTSRKTVSGFLSAYPLGVLMVALLVMICGAPLTTRLNAGAAGLQGPAGLAPLIILLTAASAYAIWPIARSRARTIIFAGVTLVLLGLSSVLLHRAFIAMHLAGQTLFLMYVIAVVVRAVFRARVVDGNILCGAVCIYLLVGVLCGFVYSLIDLVDPRSFLVTAADIHLPTNRLSDAPGWLIYFSFTTLTTVSFGDILPASEFSRSVAVLEAVMGQLMMVLLIARLVGLHVAHMTVSHAGRPASFTTREEGPGS